MKCKIENGTIEIDLYDLFEQLTEEEAEELAEAYAWNSMLWRNITKFTRSNFCAPNINSDVYKLRKLFFLMDFEDGDTWSAHSAMQSTMKYFIEENAELHARVRKMNNLRGDLYKYIEEKYDHHTAYDINSKFLDLEHGDRSAENIEDKPDYIQGRHMVDEVSFDEFVSAWVDKVQTAISGKEERWN